MKILITGGCGFLGSNLASSFLSKNNEVYVLDNLEREGSKKNLQWLKTIDLNNKLTFYKIDIRDFERIKQFFEEFSEFNFICHVAGQVAMTTSIRNPRKDIETNLIGTFNILEATRIYSSNALIAFSSTNKVYGDLGWLNIIENELRYSLKDFPNGLDENIPLDFSTPYGCSKGSADQYVRDWARVYGLNTVIFRHSSIYGGRQYASIDQGWIGWFCKKVLEQKSNFKNNKQVVPFTISGSGKQVRDVLHAEDLIALYHYAYEQKDKLYGEIFNIGGGTKNSLSILELFEVLGELLDMADLKYLKIDRRTSDQDCFIADITKAKNILNWSPKVNYKKGLEKMIHWSREAILSDEDIK